MYVPISAANKLPSLVSVTWFCLALATCTRGAASNGNTKDRKDLLLLKKFTYINRRAVVAFLQSLQHLGKGLTESILQTVQKIK